MYQYIYIYADANLGTFKRGNKYKQYISRMGKIEWQIR